MVVTVLYFSIMLLFFAVQLYLWWLWKTKDTPAQDHQISEWPTVTVLIPVKNEEENIEPCLRSVLQQNYPEDLLEIFVIDDHSTDRTTQIVKNFSEVQIVTQSINEHGKKAALDTGVERASGDIIITTDADCSVGEDWLVSIVAEMARSKIDLVTGPVWMVPDKPGFIQKYQEMEQAALNVLTYSGLRSGLILSANGANLAYDKSLYQNLDPYFDNQHIDSGDDVFFIQKAYHHGGKVGFIRQQEATAYTNPVSTFSGFIHQRIRWAGKSSGYIHWPTKLYMMGFAAVNLSFVLLLIAGFWQPIYFSWLFIGFLLKFVMDYLIIHTGMRWGHRPVCWQDVLKASLFQIVYVVYVIFLMMIGRKGVWKRS